MLLCFFVSLHVIEAEINDNKNDSNNRNVGIGRIVNLNSSIIPELGNRCISHGVPLLKVTLR